MSITKKLANNICDFCAISWLILNINGHEIIDKVAVLPSEAINANALKVWITIWCKLFYAFSAVQTRTVVTSVG